MFTRILVAIDGSAHAERALREAADIARRSDGRLTLIACVPDPSAWMVSGSPYAGIDLSQLAEEADREHQALLVRMAAEVPEQVAVDTVLAHGHPSEQILKQIADGEHDLIVMGSRGRGGLQSLVLGSVSHQVLNASPAAVLIIHSEETHEE